MTVVYRLWTLVFASYFLFFKLNAQTFIKGGFAATSLGQPSNLTNMNGTLFFTVDDGVNGNELWKSDGSTSGTVLVSDMTPGAVGSSFLNIFTQLNNELFFSLYNSTSGWELWKSDGTSNGTGMVKDIYPGANSSSPGVGYSSYVNSLIKSSNNLFFNAGNATNGVELWKTDGTAGGTILVKDIYPGVNGSNPNFLCDVNGTIFFSAYTPAYGMELWKTDGTMVGTVLVKDINSGSTDSYPRYLINVNGTLFFFANTSSNGRELWKSDGTAAGTVLVKDINSGTANSEPANFNWYDWMVNGNGVLYFFANDGVSGIELWKSDGTAAGTVLIKDINPGSASSTVSGSQLPWMRYANNEVYFQATNGINGYELWKSDGTLSGTVMVKDIFPGVNHSLPTEFVPLNNNWFFVAKQSNTTFQLCKSNGTSAGTFSLSISSSAPSLSNLTNVNGTIFFRAWTSENGEGLWKLDPNTVTYTDEKIFEYDSLLMYPNPSNGKFIIDLRDNVQITVVNILGETVLTQKLLKGENEIDLSDQPNGIYFIRSENQTFKIIKQ